MLVEKLGVETVNELFPIDRLYEIPTIPGRGAVNKPLGEGTPLAVCRGAKPSANHVILSLPCFSADEGSPQLPSAFSRTRRTAEILRSAQNDRGKVSTDAPPKFPSGFDEAALDLHKRFVS